MPRVTNILQRCAVLRKAPKRKHRLIDDETDFVPPMVAAPPPIVTSTDLGLVPLAEKIESTSGEIKDIKAACKITSSGSQESVSEPTVPLTPEQDAVFARVCSALSGGAMKNAQRLVAMKAYYTGLMRGATPEAAARAASLSFGVTARWQHVRKLVAASEKVGDVVLDGRTSAVRRDDTRWVHALLAGEEKELQLHLIDYIRENTGKRGRRNVSLRNIRRFINSTLLGPYIKSGRRGIHKISNETARRWLRKLGFRYRKHKRTGFVDGHELSTNVEARNTFVKEMHEIDLLNEAALAANTDLDSKITELKERIRKIPNGANAHHQRSADRALQEVLMTASGTPLRPTFAPSAISATPTRSPSWRTSVFITPATTIKAPGSSRARHRTRRLTRVRARASWSVCSSQRRECCALTQRSFGMRE